MAKMGTIRLAYAMASELAPLGVTALAVTPGFLRSEAMLERFGVTEANWRDAIEGRPDFAHSETPAYVGRAVAALAADPGVSVRGGQVWASWTLARQYGFDDVDGSHPDWGGFVRRSVEDILVQGGPRTPKERYWLAAWTRMLKHEPEWSDLVAQAQVVLRTAD